MPETMPAEAVPFTPERAALVRASRHATALNALIDAKVMEQADPDAGPVYVDSVAAFDLNPAEAPCPARESLWELTLAGLVAEGVGPLDVEAMAWPLDDGGEVCRLSARWRHDLTSEDLARLLRWTHAARELGRLRLLDGLAYCDQLAGELDPDDDTAAEVAACGGDLLRCVRELAQLVGDAGTARPLPMPAWLAVVERIDHHAAALAKAAEGMDEGAALPLPHYVTECLALLDRVTPLLDHLELPATATAPASSASA